MEYQKYAVIDIGSNSLRLMTGWQEVPGTWIFSPKELATTRLGKDIDETHHLSPAGMEASFAAMERWKGQLTGIPVCAWLPVPSAKPSTARLSWQKCGPALAGTAGRFPAWKKRRSALRELRLPSIPT
mgnify:CR=1 FL=1